VNNVAASGGFACYLLSILKEKLMADYPKEQIAKLDAAVGKEAWPLIGLGLLCMAAAAILLYAGGELANILF
jgi:hypothetical protein